MNIHTCSFVACGFALRNSSIVHFPDITGMWEASHSAEALPSAASPSSRCCHSRLARSSRHLRRRRSMTARAAQQLQFEKYEGLGNDFILVSSQTPHRCSPWLAARGRLAPDRQTRACRWTTGTRRSRSSARSRPGGCVTATLASAGTGYAAFRCLGMHAWAGFPASMLSENAQAFWKREEFMCTYVAGRPDLAVAPLGAAADNDQATSHILIFTWLR